MQKVTQMDLGGVNSYLIEQDGKFVLVDTGGHMFMDQEITNRLDLLIQKMEEQGVNEGNLKLILLTHGDFDHSWNAASIRDKYKAPIALHPADIFLVDHPAKDSYKSNSKYRLPELTGMFAQMQPKIDQLVDYIYSQYVSYQPDILLQDQMNLTKYGMDGIIISTPGHTDGSVCVLLPEGKLIAGDLLVNNKAPELPYNAKDFEQLENSLQELMENNIDMVYPGHGAPFHISEFRKNPENES